MANQPMDRCRFEQLLGNLSQVTQSTDEKLQVLFATRGYFTSHQASRILFAFRFHPDKLKALEMMELRLLPMTASEARDIIGTFSFMNDKLKAVAIVKRYICDSQSREGKENVANCFVFDEDKRKALNIMRTVRSYTSDVVPAGGHQIYASLGHLFSQQRPLNPHLYGSSYDQAQYMPGKGIVELPSTAKVSPLPSKYTGHPSYAYHRGRDYAQDRGYPGCGAFGEHLYYSTPECPAKSASYRVYPAGGPPLTMHQASIGPTGFQTYTTYN